MLRGQELWLQILYQFCHNENKHQESVLSNERCAQNLKKASGSSVRNLYLVLFVLTVVAAGKMEAWKLAAIHEYGHQIVGTETVGLGFSVQAEQTLAWILPD